MKGLADYIHAQGLKAGLYTSPGPFTCAGFSGSYQHEAQDAQLFVAWGYDFLKYDWCSARRQGLDQAPRLAGLLKVESGWEKAVERVLGINLGAFAGPLLTGLLQTHEGFHWGFGIAAVGMARASNPHSANSQFFIMFEDGAFLNGQYTVVGEVVREAEPETRGRSIRWRIGALPVVTGDPAMLRLVLVNLLSNAVKFSRDGGTIMLTDVCTSSKPPWSRPSSSPSLTTSPRSSTT